MREIKCRGKSIKTKEWVYGAYVHCGDGDYILPYEEPYEDGAWIEVIPETVGQYTGLKDCKRTKEYPEGQPIYEGDILKLWRSVGANGELRGENHKPLVVKYDPIWCQFVVEDKEIKEQYGIYQNFNVVEVIGNIHDNLELLKESE